MQIQNYYENWDGKHSKLKQIFIKCPYFTRVLTWTFLHTWSIYHPLGETVIELIVKLGTLFPTNVKKTLLIFFPGMVNKWNKLEAGMKNSKSLRIFKHQLSKKTKLDLLHQLPKCHGYGSVHHCRVRLGLSALKFQRFSYTLIMLIPDTKCPSCESSPEDPNHYYLTCPTYSAPRNELLRNLATILPADFITNKEKLLHTIIFGCKSNADVCPKIRKYISQTHRFELTSA